MHNVIPSKFFEHGVDGRSISDFKPSELRDRDIPFLYSSTWVVVKSPFVWDELELDEEQIKTFKTGLDVLSNRGKEGARLEEILGQNHFYPAIIKETLLPHQITRLANIEFQELTIDSASSFGLLNDEVAETFDLSPTQIKSIRSLASDFSKNCSVSSDSLKENRARLQIEFESELSELLNEEQSLMYDDLRGRFASIHKG